MVNGGNIQEYVIKFLKLFVLLHNTHGQMLGLNHGIEIKLQIYLFT